ncbi:GAF domain-containing sensor histidine kinase [Amycolatopsis sp. FDAARGOS 1241]|uniref:sensor histidine kinase n=1 Tax=Amycolatopsis sp. FDAARGOS 1241 TaxID=2778070 RepID=UPI00194F8777|nr:GAF domain-containing sensor histidine kinase [Amycolatopsis sp. FDAARGOS 1241]QRP50264.1 GAF domain-containing sensor histidine kinase [Amycolatopsis sp. FDAARGOS 1241]
MQGHRGPREPASASEGTALTPEALDALVSVSADGLAVLDADGRFTALNDSAAALLGSAAADLIGRPAPFKPDAGVPQGTPRTVRRLVPGGRFRDLEYRLAPLSDGGQAVWFSDRTDVLRQQERLTAIARAAASVAGTFSLRATLDAVAREMVMTANIVAVQILSLDDPAADLRILGMAGFGPAADFVERLSACRRLGARVRFFDAFVGGRPVVEKHRKASIMADPRWEPLHEIMNRPDWDGFVATPMVVRARTVGVINAYYRAGEDPGPGSLAFLQAMADHAAVAIDTASLLARTRTRAQSDERRRLARDLHDSVVQQLFSMRMQAKALRGRLDRPDAELERVRPIAEELAELSASALADLRLLVFELRPLDLAEHGLVAAVRAHVESVRARTGLVIDVVTTDGLPVTGGLDVQEDLYRIVCEAVHNVVKHAGASTVEVTLRAEEDDLVVLVRDDGAGRGGGEPPGSREQLGLVSMRERTERWGGRFAAGPGTDGGWTVRAAVPLRRVRAQAPG